MAELCACEGKLRDADDFHPCWSCAVLWHPVAGPGGSCSSKGAAHRALPTTAALPALLRRWELGCLRYLHRNFDLTKVQLVGASAGGLIATLAACGVDEDKAVRRRGRGPGWKGSLSLCPACARPQPRHPPHRLTKPPRLPRCGPQVRVANRLAQEYGVFERPGGLAGIWGSLIRAWLEELLPEDAAERCAGRVRLVVTEVPSLKLRYLQDFESKQDLIDANSEWGMWVGAIGAGWRLGGQAGREAGRNWGSAGRSGWCCRATPGLAGL